ncbi:MAG TPA: choice-of-anchor D domain-containing protein, partial [Solirubrobacterales bacterium]|nr:choice-of-anchor D domain-containing protein [Solirubrobacterales bacterium]
MNLARRPKKLLGMLFQLRALGAAVAVGVLFCVLPQVASADFVQPPASPYAVGTEEIEGIATGDLNGDGRDDVVTVNWGPFFAGHPSYSVLLAKPNGSLAPAPGSPVALSESETPNRVALGDVNGDGKLDLIMTTQEGKVTVRLGNGNGTFASTPVATLTTGSGPLAVASGDLNGDGYDDIVVGNYESSNVSVFYSQGNGSFAQAPGSPYPVGSEPRTVAIGDFNGDESGDIVTANSGAFFSGAFSVLLAQEDGSYAPAPDSSLEGEYQQMAAAVGDFDGDGNLDIAGVASPNQNLSVYLGNGSGEFTQPSGGPPSIPTHWGEDLAVADFNGDGLDDIAVPIRFAINPEEENAVWVFTSEGGGHFAPAASYSIEPGSFPDQIATGDFNGDGKPDLVTANGSSNLTVLLDAEPEMVVEPLEIDFGEVGLDTTAGPEKVKITNEGLAPLQIEGVELSGADSGDFSFDDSDCAGAIKPGKSCEVEVEFEPSALGVREATLKVSQESGPTVEVELSGEGVPNPAATLTPATQDFGSHPAGGGSGPTETFTLKSTGTTALHLGSVTIEGSGAGEFDIGPDLCTGETLEPGESCQVAVTFEPGSIGAKEATLVVASDAPGTLESELTGQGAPNPGIAVTPTEFDFGSHPARTGSGPTESFKVESTGVTALEVGSVALGGTDPADFSIVTDGCSGENLAHGESCEIEVEFAPAAIGPASAELEVGAATLGTTPVELSGEGVPNPGISVTPTELDFGAQTVGAGPGPARSLTVANTGTTPLEPGPAKIGGAAAGDFRIGLNGCAGKALEPGETCLIEVGF